jgi:glycerol-3-phosphate acyltransferase PlsY
MAAAKRYSSLAALVASASAPLVLIAFERYETAALALVLTAIIWIRHRANIGRLLAGQESRIGAR